jgi:hypothetical protein
LVSWGWSRRVSCSADGADGCDDEACECGWRPPGRYIVKWSAPRRASSSSIQLALTLPMLVVLGLGMGSSWQPGSSTMPLQCFHTDANAHVHAIAMFRLRVEWPTPRPVALTTRSSRPCRLCARAAHRRSAGQAARCTQCSSRMRVATVSRRRPPNHVHPQPTAQEERPALETDLRSSVAH